MTRSIIGLVSVIAIIVVSLFGTNSPADAQDDDPEATIEALQTQVAEYRATAEARGDKINAQRTQIAELRDRVEELEDQLPEPTPRPEDSGIGDIVAVGQWEISIVSTGTQPTAGERSNTETARGIYLVVNITVRNTDNTSAEFPISAFRVVDSEDRTFEIDSDATYYHNYYVHGFFTVSDTMQPGLDYPLAVLFDVPQDASGFVLTTGGNEFEVRLDR